MVPALKLKVCPEHKGVFAVAVGAAGIGLTVAETVAIGPTQPATVTKQE